MNIHFTKKQLWLSLIACVAIILFCVAALYAGYANLRQTHQAQFQLNQLQSDQILSLKQLKHLQLQLIGLDTTLKQQSVIQSIQTIEIKLNTLEAAINKLSEQSTSKNLQSIIEAENQKLFTHLVQSQNIKSRINTSNQHNTAKTSHSNTNQKSYSHRLTAKSLPFHVTGIDIWNGQAMVTVSNSGESALMALNDTRTGWTLIDLNFETSQVTFKNRRSQLIKVTV